MLCSKSQPITHSILFLVLSLQMVLKRLQVKPAVVHKPAVQTCLQVQAGHTHVVWCCSASSHACMSLQANNLVKNKHRCHPQLYSHCNRVCKSTNHTTASARGALCHCYRHSSAGQRPAHHTQAAHRQPEDQAVIGQSGSGHSPEKQAAAPGKTSLVSHSKQLECYILRFQQLLEPSKSKLTCSG